MKWVAVDAMRLKPYKCIACGGTPRDDTVEGKPNMQAYFAEGVDYDWGKSLYLCGNCVRVLGLLRGMVDVGPHEKMKAELARVKGELKEARAERDGVQSRIDRMLDGVAAKKESQAARAKKTKEKVNA
jgi:hypothetical protein